MIEDVEIADDASSDTGKNYHKRVRDEDDESANSEK